jgi:PAS domain S-box-containing protein
MGQQAYGDEAWSGPYTAYVGRLGGDPRTDFEPVLEALPYGAFVIDVLGRILCVNRRYAALTGICRGMTLEEVIVVCDIRDLSGHPLTAQDLPEAQVLLEGEEIGQSLLRMRCPADGRQVVLASDCRPVRTADGRVIGAVVIAREVSEEVALAIGVRQVSEGRAPVDRVPVG